jgi:crotonobetainyl-CoA:carnitine CoA-transferase CaiB-like acyl-CoA transferase
MVTRCLGDDAWLAIELVDEADWNAVCDLLECPTLKLDRGKPTPDVLEQLRGDIGQWAAELRPYQAAVKLQHCGIAAGPVQDTEDLWRDPQLRSRGAIVEQSHPDIGLVEFPNSPDRMSRSPGAVQRRAPRLGEHSAEVVREWLHRTPAEVQELIDQGAMWQATTDTASATAALEGTDREA